MLLKDLKSFCFVSPRYWHSLYPDFDSAPNLPRRNDDSGKKSILNVAWPSLRAGALTLLERVMKCREVVGKCSSERRERDDWLGVAAVNLLFMRALSWTVFLRRRGWAASSLPSPRGLPTHWSGSSCVHFLSHQMVRDRAKERPWQTPRESLQFAALYLFRGYVWASPSVSLRKEPSLRAQKRIIFLASASVGFISPQHRVAYLVRTVRLSALASSASSSIFRRDFFSPGRTFFSL